MKKDDASTRVTLPEITVVRTERETDPAPMTESQKLDQILATLTLVGNHVLELDSKVEGVDSKIDALAQHLVGIRVATEDLRPRVEQLEASTHELEKHREGVDQRFEALGIAPPNGAANGE